MHVISNLNGYKHAFRIAMLLSRKWQNAIQNGFICLRFSLKTQLNEI